MKQLVFFEQPLPVTPIMPLEMTCGQNAFWIKRDDLLPFSFGGNKVRKAAEFYKEIKKSGADVVMTYGSNSSNHCRIIANMAAAMELQCHVISPEENREILYNTRMVSQFGASIETCPVNEVAQTIENRKAAFVKEGKNRILSLAEGMATPARTVMSGHMMKSAHRKRRWACILTIFFTLREQEPRRQDLSADSFLERTGRAGLSVSVSRGRRSADGRLYGRALSRIWVQIMRSTTEMTR